MYKGGAEEKMTDNKRSMLVELLCERLCVGDEVELALESEQPTEEVCDLQDSSCDDEVTEYTEEGKNDETEESDGEAIPGEGVCEEVGRDGEADGASESEEAETDETVDESFINAEDTAEKEDETDEKVFEEASETESESTDEKDSEESEEGISVEFYRVEREVLAPSKELLYSYCEENGLYETRSITERILDCPDKASREDIILLGLTYGVSAGNVSKILNLCGLEMLRPRTLYDTVLASILGDSGRELENKRTYEEYMLSFSERYCESMAVLSEMDGEFVEGAQVYAPAPNRLLSLCSENLIEYIGKKGWYFIERQRVILEKYRTLMVLFGELYDNTAINCTWNEAEARFCLRSFIERFCTVLPKRNSYTEMTVKEIEAGRIPTRELMIILTVYELSLCGKEKILYKGKGKGSKKVTKELANALFEEDGVTYLRPGLYFENEGSAEITSFEQLIYMVNSKLNSLGYCQLNASNRFDKVLLSMADIDFKAKNGGRTLVLSGLSEKAQNIDISDTYESVSALLTAFVYILENNSIEGFALDCSINEEL